MAENKKKSDHRVARPCRTVRDVTNDANIRDRGAAANSVRFVRDAIGEVGDVKCEVRVPHQQEELSNQKKRVFAQLPEKKVTAFTTKKSGTFSDPNLNSVHRVGLDIVTAKKALDDVDRAKHDPEKRLDFARKKLEECHDERERVEKDVAQAVDFEDDEVIFKDLQALDLSEAKEDELPKRKAIRKRQPVSKPKTPTIDDFHTPFAGDDRPSEPSDHDSEMIFRMLERTQQDRRRERRERQDRSHEDYFRRLDEWGRL